MTPVLPFLETMITQACNLSCLGCTNYSDLSWKGYVPWQQGHKDISSWLGIIDIPDFGIMGGEPLINPEFREWLRGCRALMPSSQLRFTTNGILLHRFPDLIDEIVDLGNIVFKITVHKETPELTDSIAQIRDRYGWLPVIEYGISRWKTKNNTRFQINRPHQFIKTYQGEYQNMRPHDSEPTRAFANCIQQTCPLLYRGKIYKCSTAGLLRDLLEKVGNPNTDQWAPYLDQGISINSSNLQIQNFIQEFGNPSQICAQCPESHEAIIDHISTVSFIKTRLLRNAVGD
jgi:organic radical activating enzyme